MKGPQAAGGGSGPVSVGLWGSRRMLVAEGRAGLLLAMAGAGGSWGAQAGPMGAVAVVGDPFWAPGTGQRRCRRGLEGAGGGCCCCRIGSRGPWRQPLTPPWCLW